MICPIELSTASSFDYSTPSTRPLDLVAQLPRSPCLVLRLPFEFVLQPSQLRKLSTHSSTISITVYVTKPTGTIGRLMQLAVSSSAEFVVQSVAMNEMVATTRRNGNQQAIGPCFHSAVSISILELEQTEKNCKTERRMWC